MIVKSNYTMAKEFAGFNPRQFGVLNGNEVRQIRDQFQIAERSDVDLQNLRDFIVLYYSELYHDANDMKILDIRSGIVGVIDQEKCDRGLEV